MDEQTNPPEVAEETSTPSGDVLTEADARLFEGLAAIPNKRSASFSDLEVTEWSEGFRFEGHAAVFDEIADLGVFSESIERGAFRKALTRGDNVPMLYHHNEGLPVLASTGGGTLRLSEDVKGLKVEADVADTSLGRDLRVLAKRGDVRGMSFGFRVPANPAGYWKVNYRNGRPHRSLLNFKKILDVSPTFDPAYVSADAEFRSLALRYAENPDVLQQILQGAYQQQEEEGDTDDRQEESTEHRSASGATNETPLADMVVELPRLAAAKRVLQIITLDIGGYDNAS